MKNISRFFKVFLPILFFVLVLSNISNTSQYFAQSLNEKVIGVGILIKIPPGGTREISYPSGYAIQFPNWIISPVGVNPTVFLRSNKINLQDFLHKNIRFEGSFYKIPKRKYSNQSFSEPYDEVILDTIYVIK